MTNISVGDVILKRQHQIKKEKPWDPAAVGSTLLSFPSSPTAPPPPHRSIYTPPPPSPLSSCLSQLFPLVFSLELSTAPTPHPTVPCLGTGLSSEVTLTLARALPLNPISRARYWQPARGNRYGGKVFFFFLSIFS